jgi:hypothetical protein
MDSSTHVFVFLSYNSNDVEKATVIAQGLKDRQLEIWFDQFKQEPGKFFVEEIDEMIKKASSTVILIGGSRFGRWQVAEMYQALNLFVEKKATVIPVLLRLARPTRSTWHPVRYLVDGLEGRNYWSGVGSARRLFQTFACNSGLTDRRTVKPFSATLARSVSRDISLLYVLRNRHSKSLRID